MWTILNDVNLMSGIGGYIGGYLKAAQMNRHELDVLHVLGQYEMQESARRDKTLSTKIGRFLLVGGILVMIFYMIIITLAKDIPLTIETVEHTGGLTRLFYGPTREVFTTLRGAVIPDWMPQILIGAMTFWFGVQRK